MSAMGQKQTSRHLQPMSALPPKADIRTQTRDVRFVPEADICGAASHGDLLAHGAEFLSAVSVGCEHKSFGSSPLDA